MHPGPMNRGVEIGSEVADDIDRSLIRQQVEMGVAVRMAVSRNPDSRPRQQPAGAVNTRCRAIPPPLPSPASGGGRLNQLASHPPLAGGDARRPNLPPPLAGEGWGGGLCVTGPAASTATPGCSIRRAGSISAATCWSRATASRRSGRISARTPAAMPRSSISPGCASRPASSICACSCASPAPSTWSRSRAAGRRRLPAGSRRWWRCRIPSRRSTTCRSSSSWRGARAR